MQAVYIGILFCPFVFFVRVRRSHRREHLLRQLLEARLILRVLRKPGGCEEKQNIEGVEGRGRGGGGTDAGRRRVGLELGQEKSGEKAVTKDSGRDQNNIFGQEQYESSQIRPKTTRQTPSQIKARTDSSG